MNIYEIAKLVEFNEKAEAQAILDYTEFLKSLETAEIDEEQKNRLPTI